MQRTFTFYTPLKYWSTREISINAILPKGSVYIFNKGNVTITVDIDEEEIPNLFLQLGLNLENDLHALEQKESQL